MVVARIYNVHGSRDYLVGWDILWGPIWSSRCGAIQFPDAASASEAIATAIAIVRPSPWIVPDFGGGSTYSVEV
jgi:hypothetical protein